MMMIIIIIRVRCEILHWTLPIWLGNRMEFMVARNNLFEAIWSESNLTKFLRNFLERGLHSYHTFVDFEIKIGSDEYWNFHNSVSLIITAIVTLSITQCPFSETWMIREYPKLLDTCKLINILFVSVANKAVTRPSILFWIPKKRNHLTCQLWNPPSLSEGGDGRRGIGRGWLINILPFSAISPFPLSIVFIYNQ